MPRVAKPLKQHNIETDYFRNRASRAVVNENLEQLATDVLRLCEEVDRLRAFVKKLQEGTK
jgi:hypothetical protein